MKEATFNTEIINSITPYWFAHKLTDTPMIPGHLRFIPNKPCDTLSCIHGTMVGIESKMLKKWQGFALRFVRMNQRDSLDEILMAGGRAFIFINVRIAQDVVTGAKRENRLIILDWAKWDKKLIPVKVLRTYPFIEGKKGRFDLNNFFLKIKHGK